MSQSQFNVADWVYIADPLGRLGQGYYEKKDDKSQKLSVAEFEQRRQQLGAAPAQNEEQKVNKNPLPKPQNSTPTVMGQNDALQLSPWENPVIGEQRAEETTLSQLDDDDQSKPKVIASTSAQAPELPLKKQGHVAENGQHERGNLERARQERQKEQESGKESAKVICTELVRQGLMSQRAHQVCSIYADRHLSPAFMCGYHFWAVPYVRWMRHSRSATWVMAFFVRYRTGEVAYQLGLSPKRTILGRLFCHVHDRMCALMGRYVHQTDYRTLYKPA